MNDNTSITLTVSFFSSINSIFSNDYIIILIFLISNRQRGSRNMDSHPRALGHASETFSETSQNSSKRHGKPVVSPSK